MCEPVTIMTALTLATTTASVYNQYKTAKAQEAASKQANEVRQEQINDQATQKAFQVARASRRERANIRLAAGEAGVDLSSGNVEGLLQESLINQERNERTIDANQQNARRAAAARTNTQLAGIQRPTLLGAGLRIAASGYQAHASSTNAYG